ncbi:MAG TPA: lysylphosphatidylglycerol synthase transmembrane domain-containing protein [Solirubrobacteraceae bacterium]|nr:lysylphosphatidylglycerol synthase transmembrane domain-containing protein [Solirubrobacteraceae bacterium]
MSTRQPVGSAERPRPPALVQVAADDLEIPEQLSGRRLRSRLLFGAGLVLVVIAIVTLLPGLDGLRTRLSHAQPGWLLLGVGLKVLSGLGYVAVFRMVFCRRMTWSVSFQIGMSELGANALFPTGGAGGLALGAWALRRGGMPASEIARRTVAFFLLTSVPNVVGVIIVGLGLATQVLPGETNLALTLLPAVIAALSIVGALLVGRTAGGLHLRQQRSEEGESSRRSRALLKTLVAIADGVNEAVALLREGNAWLISGLVAYLVFDLMVLWATFHAFGLAPPLAIVWIGYLIGELGGLIPVPGGIGGIDAGLVGTFVLYGVPITSAASAVLAYRAIALWVPALLGAAAFVLLRRTLRNESQKVAVCAPQTEMEVIGLGRVVISSR